MLLNISVAVLLMIATIGIHTGGMFLAFVVINKPYSRLLKVECVVLLMFMVSLLEVLLWGATYLYLEALDTFEEALYFSMVTFTTLGYGDVLLDQRWRVLASFEAANGIIMFGWTTAIVVAALQKIYNRDQSS